ncbi:hypothetical protein ACFX11_019268 [Malus domestica]
MTKEFVNGTSSPKSVNSTHIVLVPKVQNPERADQFRPINLCNYSYKVLSKVLANRIKPWLQKIISPMQMLLSLGDKFKIIAHEVFHFLELKKTKRKFELGIKLDMSKAYDRIEWDFLEAVIARMSFHRDWIQLVMKGIRSINFSVIVNGQPCRKFEPSRGLR